MSKHRKDPDNLDWPVDDEDEIFMIVMQAFRGTNYVIPGTIIEIYHMLHHNPQHTRWTAFATTRDETGIRYYEVYYNGIGAVFCQSAPPPANVGLYNQTPEEER